MKFSFTFMFFFILANSNAQKREPYSSSDTIKITGKVNKASFVTLKDISAMKDTVFTSIKILNHRGELKTTYSRLKAVALKKLLEKDIIVSVKPKNMSSYYFVCKAMDGFTTVFSYNELFNAAADAVFVVTAYDDYDTDNMPERPVVMALSGNNAARFGMRGLASIDVRKAE